VSATLLEHALQLAPENASAHYNYCRLQTRLRKFDLAITECQKVLTLQADDRLRIMTYSLLGQVHQELSHQDSAGAAFHSAAQLNRKTRVHDLGAASDYIEYFIQRSRDAEAQALVDEALGWAPTSAVLLMERAQLQARAGKLAEAVDTAELALLHVGDNTETERAAHVFLAKTYFRLNQGDKAQVHERWLTGQ
jgi:tetratricopeptide (TPR) repeat protein